MTTQGVQSLGLIIALLVPGGLFSWSYERKASSYGRRDIKDRVIRLAAASVLLLTLTAPIAWYAYIEFWQGIISGEASYTWEWFWRWLASGGYLAGVFLLGPAAAAANQALRDCIEPPKAEKKPCGRIREWIARYTLGRRPHPTAFEHLATHGPFLIRAKTKTGQFLAGLYEKSKPEDYQLTSHASSEPQSQDIYLRRTVFIDNNGNFYEDADGNLCIGEGGLYISADVIESAQIFQDPYRRRSREDEESKKPERQPEEHSATDG